MSTVDNGVAACRCIGNDKQACRLTNDETIVAVDVPKVAIVTGTVGGHTTSPVTLTFKKVVPCLSNTIMQSVSEVPALVGVGCIIDGISLGQVEGGQGRVARIVCNNTIYS